MPYYNLTFQDLQGAALAYIGQSITKTRYANFVALKVNEGLVKMYDRIGGVQDIAHYTCVPGKRTYLTPYGFRKDRMINVNNQQIWFRELSDNDYYSGGNSLPYHFCYFRQPDRPVIVLGPQPPDSNYPLDLWFYRSPKIMANSSQVPELPLQYQHAPHLWAAGHLCLLVSGLENTAQGLFSQFREQQLSFQESMASESQSNPLVVSAVY